MKINLKKLPLFIFFIASLYLIKETSFLFYNSTDSPDFDVYSIYFEYMFNSLDKTGREQGLFYYYFQSWYFYFNYSDFSNFNFYTLLHKSIQEVNFTLYIFGLAGFYLLLKKYTFKTSAILSSFIFVNFLPISIAQRIIFKPEIVAYAFLPWLILSIENYKETNKVRFLIVGTPFLVLSIASKGSVLAMYGVFFLIFYGNLISKKTVKKLLPAVFLFIFLFGSLSYEDINSNGQNLIELESGATMDENYNYKAPLKTIYDINMYNLVASPIKYNHSGSFIGLTLLDTFGDYFDIYWDNDSSLFSKNRRDFINIKESKIIMGPEFDSETNTLTFYLQNITDLYMRKYIGMLASIFYFYIFFKGLKEKTEHRKFLIAPLIGMFVILFHIISGFPVNNYNPELGDTLKPIYYSHFFILGAIFISTRIFNEKIKTRLILIPYIVLIIFLLGFPKTIDYEFQQQLTEINNYSNSCEVNLFFLEKLKFVDSTNNKVEECIESGVKSQIEYNFMNQEYYDEKPRFKLFNTLIPFLVLFGSAYNLFFFINTRRNE